MTAFSPLPFLRLHMLMRLYRVSVVHREGISKCATHSVNHNGPRGRYIRHVSLGSHSSMHLGRWRPWNPHLRLMLRRILRGWIRDGGLQEGRVLLDRYWVLRDPHRRQFPLVMLLAMMARLVPRRAVGFTAAAGFMMLGFVLVCSLHPVGDAPLLVGLVSRREGFRRRNARGCKRRDRLVVRVGVGVPAAHRRSTPHGPSGVCDSIFQGRRGIRFVRFPRWSIQRRICRMPLRRRMDRLSRRRWVIVLHEGERQECGRLRTSAPRVCMRVDVALNSAWKL